MEHKVSLQCSQELATGPYDEPVESNPSPSQNYFLQIRFNINSHQLLGLTVVSYLQNFRPQIRIHL